MRTAVLCAALLSAGPFIAPMASAVPPGVPVSAPRAGVVESGSSLNAMATTYYVVWYRFDGGRWHGIKGLTYYHACQVCDDYRQQGADAYIERQ